MDTAVDPRTQLRVAVRLVRESRHSDDCCCGLYRDALHAPFCSLAEERWTRAVSNLLDRILA